MNHSVWEVLLIILGISAIMAAVFSVLGVTLGIVVFVCVIFISNFLASADKRNANDSPPANPYQRDHAPTVDKKDSTLIQPQTCTDLPVSKRAGFTYILICIIAEIVLLLFIAFGIIRHLDALYEELHPASKITVYVTEYGHCYHAPGCGALWNSQIEMSLRTAVTRGYSDCERCFTPEYVADYNSVDTFSEYVNGGHASEYFVEHSFLVTLAILNIIICFPIAIIYYCYQGKVIFKTLDSCSTSHSENNPPVSTVPNAQAAAQKESPSSVVASTPTYRSCCLIWFSTYHISRHAGVTQHGSLTGQLWATMFYISTKHIRRQDIVNEIYSHFEISASSIENGKVYPESILSIIRHAYIDYGKMLNRLNIDPRSQDGLSSLWELFEKQLVKYRTPHPNARKAFFEYAAILISDASQYSSTKESQ